MVGHDAPGFHQLIDAVVARPEPKTDWFQQWAAADILIGQLQTRVQKYAFYNESLAREVVRLSEEMRDLNRQLRELHREREQA